ncbi:MAG: hypothetical protein RIB67_10665 [Miltoncostaeaceae bacterium]
MSAVGGTRMEIVAGGVPAPAELAALAAAANALLTGGGPAPDPVPAAYRSRWRRAAMVEMTEVPMGIKDNGSAWGGMA